MQRNIQIFENGVQTSYAVAELIKEKVEATSPDQFFNIAVSGGTTPRMLFELLGNEYNNSIDWKKIRLFWVDERCVDPTDSESNFGMTYDAFLQKSLIAGQNIFRIKGEDIPENEAERYQHVLLRELPARSGFPVFDLILLGMGNDGHTASIFPTDLSLIDSEFSVAATVNPYTFQKRITLTGNTLNNAKQIVFIITGESKSQVLKEIIQNVPNAQNYPAAHIGNPNGNVDFYIDKAAATRL